MDLPVSVIDAITRHAKGRNGRSFYVYDTSVMRGKIALLRSALPANVAVYFAMKPNPHPAFLKAARDSALDGIEIASMGEGKKALAAGFKGSELIFTSPGKTEDELGWSVENGLHMVHLDSLTEAHRLNRICGELGRKQDVLVRVNPNFHMAGSKVTFSGDSCKLGIDESLLPAILPQILAMPHLCFRGLHVYAASGILKAETLIENCARVFAMAQKIESSYSGVRCSTIDFGGGFGIDYAQTGETFSLETYARELSKLTESYGYGDRQFVIELGRYLCAEAGWYCTEILDIKTSLGKKQIICAGGSHHFRRPAAVENHPLTVLPMRRLKAFDGQECVHDESAFIGGPLCNTADRLAHGDIYIAHAEIGDIAVFSYAGAYGYSMSHLEFLSHPHPEEILM
ncbi:MAG: alanine racemase [Bdellovibrionales bacterium]